MIHRHTEMVWGTAIVSPNRSIKCMNKSTNHQSVWLFCWGNVKQLFHCNRECSVLVYWVFLLFINGPAFKCLWLSHFSFDWRWHRLLKCFCATHVSCFSSANCPTIVRYIFHFSSRCRKYWQLNRKEETLTKVNRYKRSVQLIVITMVSLSVCFPNWLKYEWFVQLQKNSQSLQVNGALRKRTGPNLSSKTVELKDIFCSFSAYIWQVNVQPRRSLHASQMIWRYVIGCFSWTLNPNR